MKIAFDVDVLADRLCGKPAWRFLPLSSYTAGPAPQRNRDSLQLPTGNG